MLKKFPFYRQFDQMDCGPTCLRIVSNYFGRNYSLQTLRQLSGINREGVSLLGLSHAAEKLGFRTSSVRLSYENLKEVDLPCILHWSKSHFVVLYKIKDNKIFISDPARSLLFYSEDEFLNKWVSLKSDSIKEGIALLISPTPQFYELHGESNVTLKASYFISHLKPFRKLIIQLLLGLAVGSLFQLALPFLTQSIVDVGINTRNINFIYIILIAQSALIIGRLSIELIRSWILLHITTRINISILTDFLIKLMKLPISFFDTRMMGDIMQRMNDQNNIQKFLTGPTLIFVFSFFNLIVFTLVLAYYNLTVFSIFIIGSIFYSLWVFIFLKKRRELNFKQFDIASKNQTSIIQLISGIQEIKLNNCEQQKRWGWERIQAQAFRFNIKTLVLGQYQQGGAVFINEGKNILITFIVAKAVIAGQLTLGEMLAIQYIVGQLSSPIEQLIGFIQSMQDAKISLERLNEIYEMNDEEPLGQSFIAVLPFDKSITMEKLTFKYPGIGNAPVLENIDLLIPEGKTTAIVGMSGSGKTTILKLLLRFYDVDHGSIKIGDSYLNQIEFSYWRGKCGVVMQDGFIFSDTIIENIAVGEEFPDRKKLDKAIRIANIEDFIKNLPLGLNTKIGAEGSGISQGQRQRLLIARAVYKDPEYIFFDEATNALDANNEKVIMENLNEFFKGRTVVIVAHRLSTVKNADNIVVLEKGKIIEQGTHQQLAKSGAEYFKLVKNQLDLGD